MTEFRFNEAGMRQLTESRTGEVGRYLGRVGVRVESRAKDLATEERLVRSGRYRSSIAWRFAKGVGLGVDVGSSVPYAGFLEHGTHPHIIRPRTKRAIWWNMPNDRGWMVMPDTGRPVRSVNHPGNRAYRIIERAIALVLRGGLV